LDEVVDDIFGELVHAQVALAPLAPDDLALAWEELEWSDVAMWLAGGNQLTAAHRMWIQTAAAPIVEGAATKVQMPARDAWSEPTCPVCGDPPRLSVIIEESGEFMRGSPRYLVCGRCASWWAFSRAMCPTCGEHHPDRLALYTNDRWPWARIDSCLSCQTFIKTFDLRHLGAAAVVPLVDDLATVTLDFWALEQGLTGTPRSSLRIPSQ
jgi:formate dehydrogenase accessory protein FdhE